MKFTQVAINQVDGDEERFRQKFELHLDHKKPVNQNFSFVP